MPSNLVKRRFKKKRRSCAMCKPHKMHGADRRNLDRIKADQDLVQQFQENGSVAQ